MATLPPKLDLTLSLPPVDDRTRSAGGPHPDSQKSAHNSLKRPLPWNTQTSPSKLSNNRSKTSQSKPAASAGPCPGEIWWGYISINDAVATAAKYRKVPKTPAEEDDSASEEEAVYDTKSARNVAVSAISRSGKSARPFVVLFRVRELIIGAPIASFGHAHIDELAPRPLNSFMRHLSYPIPDTERHICNFALKDPLVRQHAPIPYWKYRNHDARASLTSDTTPQYVLIGPWVP